MAPFAVTIVGRDGVPVKLCQSRSLASALYVRDRLRIAERASGTDRPMSFVTDADDPERGMLEHGDSEAVAA